MVRNLGTVEPFGTARARALVEDLLVELPDRVRHCAGVADRAAELAAAVPPEDRELLVTAAWLHDIGYAEAVVDTGFHPVDGARYLRGRGWPRGCARWWPTTPAHGWWRGSWAWATRWRSSRRRSPRWPTR